MSPSHGERTPLAGWVVSVDLWGTLLGFGDRDAEQRWRLREFGTVLAEFGHLVEHDTMTAAVLGVRALSRRAQRTSGAQPSPRDQVAAMLRAMDVPAVGRLLDVLVIAHTHAVLRACPGPAPHAHHVLRQVRTLGARLVLASNTLATPGAVIRPVLHDHGLLALLDGAVFSDELGVAKPREMFFHAVAARAGTRLDQMVHVGDDAHTDAAGALDAGCRALLLSATTDPAAPCPRIGALTELPAALVALCTPAGVTR